MYQGVEISILYNRRTEHKTLLIYIYSYSISTAYSKIDGNIICFMVVLTLWGVLRRGVGTGCKSSVSRSAARRCPLC